MGKSNLEVSAIAFGTWALGGDYWGPVEANDARNAILRALELGITLFDTAQAYGFGVSERMLADTLWGRVPPQDVVIATKGGIRRDGDKLVRDLSSQWLRAGVESSLRNLRVDSLDLFQIHHPDRRTPAEETARVLENFVREGKIRHVGVSNYNPAQMDELAQSGRVETLQPPYHMFRRGIEEEILPYCAQRDIGVLIYAPLAHGLLGGQMTPDSTFPQDDWRSRSPDFIGEGFRQNLQVVEHLRSFARERDMSLPQLAIAWTLAHPAVHVAIVGSRRAEQLPQCAAAADITLSREDLHQIDQILSAAFPFTGRVIRRPLGES